MFKSHKKRINKPSFRQFGIHQKKDAKSNLQSEYIYIYILHESLYITDIVSISIS